MQEKLQVEKRQCKKRNGENQMKIVFCGPPHSGKSVFIANLVDKLPTDAYTIIRACPDGEGTWSNNEKQEETNMVRKKGKFTEKFIDGACKAIDNQTNKIVLVDVGGIMSKENEKVFKHCDSFVVLSSDEENKRKWQKFGENLGLECIGSLDSVLIGEEEIYSRTPYLEGKITGLDRGRTLENSSILNALVSDIVKRSKYLEKNKQNNTDENFIDDTELGFKLGYGKELYTEDGTAVKKVKWAEQAVPFVYTEILKRVDSEKELKINGIRANFIVCAICKAAKQKGTKDIKLYDIMMKKYIPIILPTKKRGLKIANGLKYTIIESKEDIFMDVDITEENYSLENYEKIKIPKINEKKNLYLSGRMPLWLLASICNSYDSNKIFTFQPGKGFTCVSSIDEKDLGKIVDGIDGIDINTFFKDKMQEEKNNSLTVIKKENLLSKIRSILSKNNEKQKYLNNKLKARTVEQANVSFARQHTLKESLIVNDITNKINIYNTQKQAEIQREANNGARM